jgi:DNA-binding transcriptional LysR family regulator
MEPVMEFDNVETVKRAVEINAGIAILPQTTVTREEAQGLLKVIKFKTRFTNGHLRSFTVKVVPSHLQ